MERLAGAAEILDGALDDPAALRENLRDLRRINRLLGGVRLSARAVDVLLDGHEGPATMLDVGTGAADIPLALLARARRRGDRLAVTATDARPEVLDAARALDPRLDRVTGLTLALADGRALPYPNGAFDVAHASLVLHHLERAEAISFLGELRRVSRAGVVVNDLSRGLLRWLAAWLLTHTIAPGRYTRHDGPLSVRRAYTAEESRGLLNEAGVTPLVTISGIAGHRYAIAAR